MKISNKEQLIECIKKMNFECGRIISSIQNRSSIATDLAGAVIAIKDTINEIGVSILLMEDQD